MIDTFSRNTCYCRVFTSQSSKPERTATPSRGRGHQHARLHSCSFEFFANLFASPPTILCQLSKDVTGRMFGSSGIRTQNFSTQSKNLISLYRSEPVAPRFTPLTSQTINHAFTFRRILEVRLPLNTSPSCISHKPLR